MQIRKYAVVYHEISKEPLEYKFFMEDLDDAIRFAHKKADEGYLPVYILDNETEEVVYDA